MRKLLIVLLVAALVLPAAGPAFADTTYIVQSGDTLSAIAQRFGVSLSALIAANNLTNPNLIFVGQRLTIPGPGAPGTPAPTSRPAGTYIVQRGDTLFPTSLRFAVSLHAVMPA